MLLGSKVMADVGLTGVMLRKLALFSRLTVKVSIYPAVILTFPEILASYKRLLNSGHSMLLLRVSALIAFNLKSNIDTVNTGKISQLRSFLGFLNSNSMVIELK